MCRAASPTSITPAAAVCSSGSESETPPAMVSIILPWEKSGCSAMNESSSALISPGCFTRESMQPMPTLDSLAVLGKDQM